MKWRLFKTIKKGSFLNESPNAYIFTPMYTFSIDWGEKVLPVTFIIEIGLFIKIDKLKMAISPAHASRVEIFLIS